MYNFDDVDLAIIGIVIIDALSLAYMHDKALDFSFSSLVPSGRGGGQFTRAIKNERKIVLKAGPNGEPIRITE